MGNEFRPQCTGSCPVNKPHMTPARTFSREFLGASVTPKLELWRSFTASVSRVLWLKECAITAWSLGRTSVFSSLLWFSGKFYLLDHTKKTTSSFLSLFLSHCLSRCLSLFISSCVSVCLSLCLSICTLVYVHVSPYLFLCDSDSLFSHNVVITYSGIRTLLQLKTRDSSCEGPESFWL